MPKTKISEFSATPANNTDIDSINIAEGCAPSGINDAIRELMAQLKDFQTGAVGDSFNGPIGTSTAAAGAFTTLSSTGNTTLGDASGDAVTINGTATFANANPTLTAGTANGVTYLNGSKVLTSGSALTFDGTTLALTGVQTITNSSGSTLTLDRTSNPGSLQFNFGGTQTGQIQAVSGGGLVFYQGSSPTEGMRLTSTGLGIGTSSPKEKLDVRGASVFSGDNATGTNAYGTAAGILLSTSSDNTKARITAVSNGANSVSLVLRPLSSGSAVDAVTIDSAGNLGLGTATITSGAGWTPKLVLSDATAPALIVRGANSQEGSIGCNNGVFIDSLGNTTATNNNIIFRNTSTNSSFTASERARITSDGNLLVGTTGLSNNGKLTVNGDSRFYGASDSGAFFIDKATATTTTSQILAYFTINNQTTGSGQINANGASQAAFGSFSDARLKQNIIDLPSQLSNIMALRPVEFDYIESEGGGHQVGFVAQEMETVFPDAVGERTDGMKTVTGWNKTEAILVKAIQELKAEFDAYKASHP